IAESALTISSGLFDIMPHRFRDLLEDDYPVLVVRFVGTETARTNGIYYVEDSGSSSTGTNSSSDGTARGEEKKVPTPLAPTHGLRGFFPITILRRFGQSASAIHCLLIRLPLLDINGKGNRQGSR